MKEYTPPEISKFPKDGTQFVLVWEHCGKVWSNVCKWEDNKIKYRTEDEGALCGRWLDDANWRNILAKESLKVFIV